MPLLSLVLASKACEGCSVTSGRVIIEPFSTIKGETVQWLDPGRIPLGTLTILDGDPGLGKTTVALDYAARVSKGLEMPSGEQGNLFGKPSRVLVMSAEDDPAATLQPKLAAMGADLDRVRLVRGIRHDEEDDEDHRIRSVDLRDVIDVMNAPAAANARLLIVDPFMAYIPANKNAHRDQDMRSILSPLIQLADVKGFAILMIRHLNKLGSDAQSVSALYRGGGSIGIAGAARSVLLVASDPGDESRKGRVLVRVKGNLSEPPKALLFHLEAEKPYPAIVVWDGIVNENADGLLKAPSKEYEPTQVAEAGVWLFPQLEKGPRPATQLLRDAKKIGIQGHTLRRARDRIGAKYRRGEQGLEWYLPDDGKTPEQRLEQPLRGRPRDNGKRIGMICHFAR